MTSALCNLPIAMDGRMLVAAGTGVATYARALRTAQRAITPDALTIGADGGGGTVRRLLSAATSGRRRLRRDGNRLVSRDLFRVAHVHFGLYRRLLTLTADGPPGIIHWTYPVPLRIAGWSNLYTVHDVIPLEHPELTPIDARRHARTLAAIVAHAARIVTVSQTARAAIAAHLPGTSDRIVDCSQPVDLPAMMPAGALPPDLERGRYLLVVGSVEPRKNVARIVSAWRTSGAALPLVVAGPDGWQVPGLDGDPAIVRLTGLDRGQMLALIAGARALLMPSLAEGFGLPVAEAMTLATPVLTADTGALAETAGGAALGVDPLDEGEIAAGIGRLVRDDALCDRLATLGRAQAARFAPTAFAARLGALYAEVASEGGAAYPPSAV